MSRYDVLARRAGLQPLPGGPGSGEPAETGAGNSGAAGRRGNPTYRQFSAYIPAELYRRLKMRLAEQERELSVAVEEAITEWLAKDGLKA